MASVTTAFPVLCLGKTSKKYLSYKQLLCSFCQTHYRGLRLTCRLLVCPAL